MRNFEIDLSTIQDEFIATIKNLTNKRLFFIFENVKGYNFDLNPYDYIIIRNDEHGWKTLDLFRNKQYKVFKK